MKSEKVTDLSAEDARKFFLKESSYASPELPDYFHFDQLIASAVAEIGQKQLPDLCKKNGRGKPILPSVYEGVNYTILSNKDGAYSWRPLQLIHPVLYVEFVNLLTDIANWSVIVERFKVFEKSQVKCISIPRESLDGVSDKAAQIVNWWDKIEQESLRKALQFSYIYTTDITDCYGSIYTHSLEWALHNDGKSGVKAERAAGSSGPTLGGSIDSRLRNMNYGQTNGIPQGSVLSDFLAEIVLGYSDIELTKRLDGAGIQPTDYCILRYRDDYRILTNNPTIGHRILKELNSALHELGLKMHPGKTKGSDDVILASLKPEKLEHIEIAPVTQHFQKEALRIYQLSKKYPNSGIILKELDSYYVRISKRNVKNVDFGVLISIFTMIPVHSPRTINLCAAILSRIMERTDKATHIELVELIIGKFANLPNVGFIEIWLQRIAAPLRVPYVFTDPLTGVALGSTSNSKLWESAWLEDSILKAVDAVEISELPAKLADNSITPTISKKEVETFRSRHYDW
jgi:RNA-directed DNA polymerase